MGKIVLAYWPIHGFASSIRLLLEVVGADYEEEIYTIEEHEKWFKEKKDNLGLLYPNLPYMIHDDVKMTEHLPIMRYIARKYGLYPQTEQELIVSDQTESFLCDIRFGFRAAIYVPIEDYEKSKTGFLEVTRKKLPYLNKVVEQTEYITGNKLTYVDILTYDTLVLINALESSLLKENPNLEKYMNKIRNLPQIQNYYNGKGIGVCKERSFCAPFVAFKGRM